MTAPIPPDSLFRLHLVGMPAAGKTTLGRALAAQYAVPFLDLDEEIVRHEGCGIADIFAQHGEAYFREAEAAALRLLLHTHERLVLATGGGTPCFHHNMELLNQTGLTLWLDVPLPTLVARVQQAAATRPLLAALPDETALTARLRETLAARSRFYEQATLRLTGSTGSVEAAHALVQRYRATG